MLRPEHAGLSQPWATVIAATIALAAAIIALVGLRLQINANAAEAQRNRRSEAARGRVDRRAAAELAQKHIDAETERTHAAERINLFAESADVSMELNKKTYFLATARQEDKPVDGAILEYDELYFQLSLKMDLMRMHGLIDSANMTRAFMLSSNAVVEGESEDWEAASDARRDMLSTFTHEISKHGGLSSEPSLDRKESEDSPPI